ncbi:hypothetical protein NL676_034610 [Syzygium grande]|nr:hypothetical protein NL676_034610 [Syzygium grande]
MKKKKIDPDSNPILIPYLNIRLAQGDVGLTSDSGGGLPAPVAPSQPPPTRVYYPQPKTKTKPQGSSPDIHIPDDLTLHGYCFQHLSKFADRPCVINGATGQTYTYAEVELTSRRIAAGLDGLGVGQGT